MRVIISKSLQDNFTQFQVVDTFKKVRQLDQVSVLVIHEFSEPDLDIGIFISEFVQKGIDKIVYISEHPRPILCMLLNGINGVVIRDEFYLDDETELISLIDEVTESSEADETSIVASSLGVVQDFMSAFARGDERIQAPIYLERVNSALNELAEINKNNANQLCQLSQGTLAVFERASTIIRSMDEQNKLLSNKLNEVEALTMQSLTPKTSLGGNVMFFPSFKYMGNARVLVVREYSPCRYLTSFLLGYTSHVHYELNKRVKLVFVHAKMHGVSAKYQDFTNITQESMAMASLYDSEIVATNNPKKEVMSDLLSRQNDVVIVLDRLYGSQAIVTGRVVQVNACGSRSDIQRYKLTAADTIFSVTSQPQQLFSIPTIKNFPTDSDARYAVYSKTFSDRYAILDKRLQLA